MRWQRVQQPDDLLLGKPAYPSLRLWIEADGWRFLDPLPRTGCPLQYGPQQGEVAIGGGAGTLRCLCLANRLNLVPRDRMQLAATEVPVEPLELDRSSCAVALSAFSSHHRTTA